MDGVESCQTESIPAISFLVDDSNVPLCALCQRMLASDEESANVCGDCKFLLLEDFGSPSLPDPGHSRRRRRRRTRSTVIYRASGSESETDNQLTTPTVTPDDGSRRWRMLSDAESSGALYNSDSSLSLNGEGESNASFRIFYESSDAVSGVWESDTDHSLLEETDTLFLSSLARGDLNSDSDDIDPMHAGRINWYSEEEEPQVRINEVRRRRGNSSSGSSGRGGFEEYWLQQETGFLGTPAAAAAAAKSVVDSLPLVVIKANAGDDDYGAKSKESNCEASSLSMCAICKDMFLLGSEALQLPCAHLYHPHCILPWLSTRNSCPVCRYELPTDDLEYEESWRTNNNNGDNNASGLLQHHLGHDIESHNSSSGVAVEAGEEEIIEQQEQLVAVREHVNDDDDGPNSQHTDKKRWFSQVTAAAPVVSLMGLVFVILVGKPIIVTSRRRTNLNLPNQGGRWWQWRWSWF